MSPAVAPLLHFVPQLRGIPALTQGKMMQVKLFLNRHQKCATIKSMIANFITGSRIIFSLAMLTFPVFSAGFYFCYMLAGFTDMIDGTIARKLGTESKFGRNFDTIADIVFVALSAYKLFPEFIIPWVIWLWISIIALIKIINIILGFVRKKKFTAVHSLANKVTGAVLFLLPLTLTVLDIRYSSIPVCMIASFAAIQEGFFIFRCSSAGGN